MEVSKDFEEFFELFNKNNVKYLVVGGYAFAIYAKPRYTNDIDIFFDANRNNAKNVLKTLNDFGFGELEISIEDLTKPNQVIQLWYPPLRIDLLTSIDGVEFLEAWERKVTCKYGQQDIQVISKLDLIRNKKASGRKKDLDDLELLL